MFKDKTIVFTSGTFDMFHYNHLRMINYARALADILIVGVSTDELVMSYKDKPVIPFQERLQIIEALKTPDIVIPQYLGFLRSGRPSKEASVEPYSLCEKSVQRALRRTGSYGESDPF